MKGVRWVRSTGSPTPTGLPIAGPGAGDDRAFAAIHPEAGRVGATLPDLGCGLAWAALHRTRPRVALRCPDCGMACMPRFPPAGCGTSPMTPDAPPTAPDRMSLWSITSSSWNWPLRCAPPIGTPSWRFAPRTALLPRRTGSRTAWCEVGSSAGRAVAGGSGAPLAFAWAGSSSR